MAPLAVVAILAQCWLGSPESCRTKNGRLQESAFPETFPEPAARHPSEILDGSTIIYLLIYLFIYLFIFLVPKRKQKRNKMKGNEKGSTKILVANPKD